MTAVRITTPLACTKKTLLTIVALLACAGLAMAQSGAAADSVSILDSLSRPLGDDFSLIREVPITINLDREEALDKEAKEHNKKKRKKKVFFGIKTRKGFTRSGYGNNVSLETFYYLKEPLPVDPYVPEIYWYDFKRKTVRNTGYDPKNTKGAILHGPYKRMVDDQVVEQGIFYIGTKHGRWTEHDRNNILTDKRKYYKGWPKESLVRYYDKERTKLKEVIPIQYGKKEGNYYLFHDTGLIAVKGEYENDEKVGKWTEYYKFPHRRKKEVQYAPDAWADDFRPYTSQEWDKRGKQVYAREE
jgi:antitoxin component YwqK of YwqJK toxin-antitoxin module